MAARRTAGGRPNDGGSTTKGDIKRREILDKAAALFSRAGYANASMEDIAAANKMSKSALYHYFRSREEILFEMHEILSEQLLGHARQLDAEARTPGEQLKSCMLQMILANETIPGYVQVFFQHYKDLSRPLLRRARANREEYEEFVEEIIRRGIASGEFRAVDPHISALAVFGMCNWTFQWFKPSGPMSGSDVATIMADIVLQGLNLNAQSVQSVSDPSTGADLSL